MENAIDLFNDTSKVWFKTTCEWNCSKEDEKEDEQEYFELPLKSKDFQIVKDFDDTVYCVTVPNSTLLVKRNGKVVWCGNSPRQVSECYTNLDKTVNMQTPQASYWSNHKEQIGRILKPNGICITCGWNSGGIGKKYGMEIQEILLVAHGGWHNDTIVTIDKKVIL